MFRTRLLLSAGALALALAVAHAAAPPPRPTAGTGKCCQECRCETCCMQGQGQGLGQGKGQGLGKGQGKGKGQGFGKGKGSADHKADMEVFHYLLDRRKEITRKVTEVTDGVSTLTESKNKAVAARIQEHALAMHKRVKEGRPIHMRDPLFREIFSHYDKISMTVTKTPAGVRVKETSEDAYVASLIKAHAKVVSGFLANGYGEVRKNHEVPARPKGK